MFTRVKKKSRNRVTLNYVSSFIKFFLSIKPLNWILRASDWMWMKIRNLKLYVGERRSYLTDKIPHPLPHLYFWQLYIYVYENYLKKSNLCFLCTKFRSNVGIDILPELRLLRDYLEVRSQKCDKFTPWAILFVCCQN